MHIGIFIVAILILIWAIAKIYQRVRQIRDRIANLEHELHITRKRLYTLSKILDKGTKSYMDNIRLASSKGSDDTTNSDGLPEDIDSREYYSFEIE